MAIDIYVPGSWNCICDRCGFEYKSYELKKTWDGLMVCSKDWEPRHPQDYVRGVKDDQSTPFSKPEAIDTFTVSAQALPIPPFHYD